MGLNSDASQLKFDVDITIVGASLAGLMAARALKKAGITRFKILDAKSEIGLPLKCGEAVDAQVFDELFAKDLREKPAFIENEIHSHEVFCNATSRKCEATLYYELNRPDFERWLAEPVMAHLQLETRIEQIERETSGFKIHCKERPFSTRAVILCCGANYQFQKSLELLRKEPELGYAWGGIYEGKLSLPQNRFLWDLMQEAEGYAWSFPKEDGIFNLGVAGLHARKLHSAFQRFQERFQLEPSQKPKCSLGGRYPASGVIKKTYGEGILVCGDAAGMVFAGTGEGIPYALLSGNFAGQVMAEAYRQKNFSRKNLRMYEARWKTRFGKQLKAGVYFKHILTLLQRTDRLEKILLHTPDSLMRDFMKYGRIPPKVLLKYFYRKWATF